MKNKIFGLLLLAVPLLSLGQSYSFGERVNLAFFTGGFARQQNSNNNGYWYGAYADFVPIRSYTGWSGGIFGLVSIYQFQDNDLENIYNGHGRELGGGLSIGKYSEYFGLRHSAFIGCNLGLRQSQDHGIGKNKYGQSEVLQEDWMFSINLNFNILKTNGLYLNLFPRTQIMLNYQEPFKSEVSAAWNGKSLNEQVPWKKGFSELVAKESIVDIPINRGRDLFLEPKLLAAYRYEKGNRDTFWVTGLEIGLRKADKDDFLAIFFTQKINTQKQDFLGKQSHPVYFMVGLNFCPFNIKN